MPFKSDKQKTYLAINEPEVYKKFRKEEVMSKRKGGGIYKKKTKTRRERGVVKDDFSLPKKHRTPRGGYGKYVTGRVHGGKVDNSGQQMVAKQYGGKVK